jgi:hypothetical protein
VEQVFGLSSEAYGLKVWFRESLVTDQTFSRLDSSLILAIRLSRVVLRARHAFGVLASTCARLEFWPGERIAGSSRCGRAVLAVIADSTEE